MQITADTSKILKKVQRDLIFIFDVLSELRIGFVLFFIFLVLKNVVSFIKLIFYRKRNVSRQQLPQFGIKFFDNIFLL